MSDSHKIRAIAFYLPQFHPIPENDEWWGKGFTEWTNTAKAKPLFPGHYQPHVPADLGFYDLRVPETRAAQADMARSAGIEGFCYYHYWFAGRRILERPFQEVLQSGAPNFPFCICWANESWTGVWHGAPKTVLIEQNYPGEDDHREHFESLLPAFRDPRYIKVNGKPLFVIYNPQGIPETKRTIECWQKLAKNAGLVGIHFVGVSGSASWNPIDWGFDAKILQLGFNRRDWVSKRTPIKWLKKKFGLWHGEPTKQSYNEYWDNFREFLEKEKELYKYPAYPSIVHAWDNTPRSGNNGFVLTGEDPREFSEYLSCIRKYSKNEGNGNNFIFFKSWNEWAEGNHLEPDFKYGSQWLSAVQKFLSDGDRKAG
jgi:lipopolysaccharide biosynthesis protein